tara:strand:- start:194 stop:646 length:453 start_codon:yes stop_codon:yes gene_type:complete
MDRENKDIKFLETALEEKIRILKSKSKSLKTKANTLKGLSIFLGAFVTLILGFDVYIEYQSYQKNTALIFGFLLTVVSGMDAAFNYKSLWIRQKTTLLSLYQLQNELSYLTAKAERFDLDDLFDKYQKIWEQDSSDWLKIVRQKVKMSNK